MGDQSSLALPGFSYAPSGQQLPPLSGIPYGGTSSSSSSRWEDQPGYVPGLDAFWSDTGPGARAALGPAGSRIPVQKSTPGDNPTFRDFVRWLASPGNEGQVAMVEHWLYDGGFYTKHHAPPDYTHLGRDDLIALRAAGQAANQTGIPFADYLSAVAETVKSQPQPHVPSSFAWAKTNMITDPVALGSALDDAFPAALGRMPTPQEKTAFIEAFHGHEKAYNAAVNNYLTAVETYNFQNDQGVLPAGAQLPKPPQGIKPMTPDEAAKANILEQHQTEHSVFLEGGRFGQILEQLMGHGAAPAPTGPSYSALGVTG